MNSLVDLMRQYVEAWDRRTAYIAELEQRNRSLHAATCVALEAKDEEIRRLKKLLQGI